MSIDKKLKITRHAGIDREFYPMHTTNIPKWTSQSDIQIMEIQNNFT